MDSVKFTIEELQDIYIIAMESYGNGKAVIEKIESVYRYCWTCHQLIDKDQFQKHQDTLGH